MFNYSSIDCARIFYWEGLIGGPQIIRPGLIKMKLHLLAIDTNNIIISTNLGCG
jgi:hypothetical protein